MHQIQNNESYFMAEAVRLAHDNVSSGKGGPFGAIIVKDNIIIARGTNNVLAHNDPTAHAEVMAIRAACEYLNSFILTGCEIYTSCEPCPMCLSAIYWARIEKIYYAGTRQDAAAIGFDDEFLYRELTLDMEQRSIPIVKVLSPDVQAAFKAWELKQDKTPY
jgi:guanine deaminase